MQEQRRKYHILGVLGHGGFGRVYRARMDVGTSFSKEVAIKVLHDPAPDPELLKRFRDEARILGLVRDRALVNVDPPARLGNRWAVVMDLVDGESCGSLLKRHGSLPPGVSIEIIGELARVLDKAYHFPGPDGASLEVLHRDIKPANVQITPTGEVRLLDFGVAKATFASRESNTAKMIAGTPGFMAPERFSGIEGPEGDVYGLGVLLWMLLTGEKASRRTAMDLSSKVDALAKRDGEPRQALLLAARMRHPDHRTRPTAREVERACRAFRRRFAEPFLREWSETHVDGARGGETDGLVGTELTEARGADLHGAVTEVLEPNSTRTTRTGLLMGGALTLAGSVTMVVTASSLLAVLVWWITRPPVIVPLSPVSYTVAILDTLEELRPDRSEESIPGVPIPIAPVSEPPVAEPEVPEPAPEPQGPVATLTFRSIPWGAVVTLDGKVCGQTPLLAFPVSWGDHNLQLQLGEESITRTIRVGARSPNDYLWGSDSDELTAGFGDRR